jgi:hypothetical protein
MRRRRTSSTSMSLFPFLDTLVCTMGALILLLVAMTPKIKERAMARQAAVQEAAKVDLPPIAAEEPEAPPVVAEPTGPTPEELAAEHERRRQAWLAELEAARQTLRTRQVDMQARRDQLLQAQKRLQELRDELKKSQSKTQQVVQKLASLEAQTEEIEAQSAVVSQKIAATRKEIDVAQRRQATSKNEYALVAYDGSSGTNRRPIYIECTSDGFRFLTENVFVPADDLENFTPNFNPLLAGAKRLIQYWTRRQREMRGAQPEPYVLLIVRPSGAMTYYRARAALSGLGALWGYELIEEDWKLSTPPVDPVAKELLVDAIQTTNQLGHVARSAVVGRGRSYGSAFDPDEVFEDDLGLPNPGSRLTAPGNDPRLGTRASRNGGEPGSGQQYASRGGSGSSRPADLAGRQDPGNGGVGRGGAPTSTRTGNVNGFGGKGTAGDGDSASQDGIGIPDEGGGPRGENPGGARGMASRMGRPGNSPGTPGTASGGAGREPGDGTEGAGAGDQFRDGVMMASPGRSSSGGSTPGRARPATLGGNSLFPENGNGEGDGANGGEADGAPASRFAVPDIDEVVDGSGPSSSGLREPRRLPAGSPGRSAREAGSETGNVGENTPAGSEHGVGAAANDGNNTGKRGANSTANNGARGPSSKLAATADAGNASAEGAPNGPMGGPGLNIDLGSGQQKSSPKSDEADQQPRIADDAARDNHSKSGSGGGASGPRRWGHSGRRAGIGLEKQIKVYLNEKRIVIHNREYMLLLSPQDSREEITNRVVSAINHIAEGWGEAPSNFYWVPVVQFNVYPGGDDNYARLKDDLEHKWGVTSSVKYVDNRSKKPAATTKTSGEAP